MKRRESDYNASTLVFAEEIKIADSEYGMPEIWISDQLIAKFREFLQKRQKTVFAEEVLAKSMSGNLVDVYRIVLREKLAKGDSLVLVRDFLTELPIDWFETVDEHSAGPSAFTIPSYQVKKKWNCR